MKSKMDKEEIINFFQGGIVTDLMYATRHYFIWRTIGENHSAIKDVANKNFDSLFGELQASSKELAILSLAKIFDSHNAKYPVRSIHGFLDNDFEATPYFPMFTDDYKEFSILRNNFDVQFIPVEIKHPNDLSHFLNKYWLMHLLDKKLMA